MRRLLLHIGLEKTGSTSFQAYCAAHRARLGAVYPVNPLCFARDNHAPLAASYFSPEDAARLRVAGRRAGRAEAVAALKAEAGETTLVSAEHFSSRFDPGRIAALAEDLADFDVTVAAVARDPVARALSAYATTVASGRDLTLAAFVEELCQPDNLYLRAHATLAPWARTFGRARMVVIGYVEGGDVVALLAERLFPRAPAASYRRNVSPPPAEIERRRRANALGGLAGRLWRRVGARPAEPPALSAAQRRRIAAFAADDLAALQADYGVALQSHSDLH